MRRIGIVGSRIGSWLTLAGGLVQALASMGYRVSHCRRHWTTTVGSRRGDIGQTTVDYVAFDRCRSTAPIRWIYGLSIFAEVVDLRTQNAMYGCNSSGFKLLLAISHDTRIAGQRMFFVPVFVHWMRIRRISACDCWSC